MSMDDLSLGSERKAANLLISGGCPKQTRKLWNKIYVTTKYG
jgi:hypothetical protein